MRSTYKLILTIIGLLVFSTNASDQVETFGNLPLVKDLQISPNGKQIAYLQNVEGKYHIVSKGIGKNARPAKAFALDEAEIRSFEWGSDGHIFFYATIPYYSRGDYETFTMFRLGLLEVETNEVSWPFNKGRKAYAIGAPTVINKLIDKPNHVLVAQGQKVLIVDLTEGDKDDYFDEWNGSNVKSNAKGEPVIYERYTPRDHSFYWMYKKPQDEEYSQLKIEKDGKQELFEERIIGIAESDNRFYFYQRLDEDLQHLMKAEVENNLVKNIKKVSKSKKYDVDSVIRDPHNSQVIGYSYIKDFPEYRYFDQEIGSVHADLKATFPNAEVEITSYSKDRNRFIAKVSGRDNPLEYFYYDKKAGQLAMVTSAYPNADKKSLGIVKKYVYTTDDKFEINAYLTIPANSKGKVPLIVMPHGGPEWRDNMSFSWMRQFYASHGYAVFQPNFRGSSGYGKKFAEAGYGEWGKRMQSDVDIGVQKLISEGVVDKNKICVVGASYGGYVAMYSATKRHDLYKCGVSFGGVSDLDDLYFHSNEQRGTDKYYHESIGARSDQETLRKHSPLFMVSEKTRPLLLLHGEKDTIVPSFQSQNMHKALKKAKVPGVKYIELEEEDHWFTLQSSRKIFLKESIEFIKENI